MYPDGQAPQNKSKIQPIKSDIGTGSSYTGTGTVPKLTGFGPKPFENLGSEIGPEPLTYILM